MIYSKTCFLRNKPFAILLFRLFILIIAFIGSLSAQTPQPPSDRRDKNAVQQQIDRDNARCLGLIRQQQYQNADVLANQIAQRSEKAGYTRGLADVNVHLGMLSQYRFDYKHALSYYLEGMKAYETLQDKEKTAAIQLHIGEIFLLEKEEIDAIKHFKIAYEDYESLSDTPGKALSLEWIGKAYLQKKIYGQATEFLKRAMDTWLEAGKTREAAAIATQLAQVTLDLGDYDGCRVYNHASLDMHSSLGLKAQIADDFAVMTRLNLRSGDAEGAIASNQMEEQLRKELKDSFGLADVYLHYALSYIDMGRREEASKWLKTCLETVAPLSFHKGLPDLYQAVSQAYEQIKMPEKALAALHLHLSSKDSLFQMEKSTALLEIAAKYESEVSIREKNEQIARLKDKQAWEIQLRYALAGAFVLLALLTAFLLYHYRIKKKDNRLLQEKNAEINAQNRQIQSQKEILDLKNMELAEINRQLEEKNVNLDLLNSQLIHEMAERETLEKSSFARDHFLATVSHTMRNPLNAILGLSHQLTENNKEVRQAILLKDLQFAANDLVVLINDLLDYSRIEAGKLTLDNREFSLTHLSKEVTNYFKNQKKLNVKFIFADPIREKLWGDPSRLHQIITHIVNHFYQQVQSDKQTIHISTTDVTDHQVRLQILFRSDNHRFENDILNNMYELFKGHPVVADQESDGNPGKLSLAITKRLIELQNGSVQINVNKENVVEICVMLPYQIAGASLSDLVKQRDDESALQGRRVLVVEDNKINQLVVVNLLRKHGLTVDTADNGLEAIDKVNQQPFDLILMDILMPEMDGYRATSEIRKHPQPAKSRIPIIALTASAFLTEKEKARLFGMTDYIGKPFAPEELIDKMIEVIIQHETTNQAGA